MRKLIKRLFGLETLPERDGTLFGEAALSLNRERLIHGFERSPSFSFLLFNGDVAAHIPALLEACGYRIRRVEKWRGTLQVFNWQMGGPPDETIVQKGYFLIPGYTVLVDPEMVLMFQEQALTGFCRDQTTEAWVAMWERVSETAVMVRFSPAGRISQSWHCQGVSQEEQIAPIPGLSESPDSEGLKRVLAKAGVPITPLFDEAEMTVLELQE